MKTQEEFFQEHQVEGQLSQAQMAELVLLPSGDTSFALAADDSTASPAVAAPAPADSPVPGPTEGASAPAAPAATPAPAQEPVIVAKDGVHTIPFEKLAEAREGERVAREEAARLAAEAEALRQQLATAQAPAASPAPTAAPAPAGEKVSFGDYSDDAITQGVEKVAAQAVAKAVAPLQAELESLRGKLGEKEQQAVVDATTGHMTAIYTAHPDLDSILESREFAAWKGSLPAYAQPGVEQTLEAGTAQQVVELFNDFKKATGTTQAAATPSPAPSPAASAAARAAAAIAAAQTKTPTSLSEIPAGASAHVDEGSAMAAMTPEAALARFEKLNSPDQIEALLNRVI